jgi:SRSO17 transposase
VIDDTGFPKQGGHSVGVDRQYSGTLGKTANCQIAVSLHEVCTEGAAVLSWRLYLPESWANDAQRRVEAGIPKEVKFRKKWELALEMIDQARGWELTDRIVVTDAGYGDVTAFGEELEIRKLRYVVGVQSTTGVWVEPPRARKLKAKQSGRPPSARHYGKQRPASVKEAAQQAQGWKKFAGGKAAKAGWSLASGRVVCRLPMDFMKAVLPAKRSGCSWSGRKRSRSPAALSV